MARLYDLRRWRNGRLRHLRDNPLCVECKAQGKFTPAQVVDHNPPHNNNFDAFFTESTWRSLCKPCHDRKTASRDTGFGNKRITDADKKVDTGCVASGFPVCKNHHWNKAKPGER